MHLKISVKGDKMNTALIMAGGSGKRMRSAKRKQLLILNDKPIIQHTLEKFNDHKDIDHIVLVIPEAAKNEFLEILSRLDSSKITLQYGGKERQQSVINGLNACPENTDIVLIHDGVRPFVKAELITELIDCARKFKAVIPVSKMRNTVKEVHNGIIKKTVPRENLYNALTPQVFEYNTILECHKKAQNTDIVFTDDSSILEYYNIPVHVIVTDESNLKITEPHDLKIAQYLLNEFS